MAHARVRRPLKKHHARLVDQVCQIAKKCRDSRLDKCRLKYFNVQNMTHCLDMVNAWCS